MNNATTRRVTIMTHFSFVMVQAWRVPQYDAHFGLMGWY